MKKNKPGIEFLKSVCEETFGNITNSLGLGAYQYHVIFKVSPGEAVDLVLKQATKMGIINKDFGQSQRQYLLDEISWRDRRHNIRKRNSNDC